MLYMFSDDGLEIILVFGIVLDHQNKRSNIIIEGKINNTYYALTRPLGEDDVILLRHYVHYIMQGPTIQRSLLSPDLLHWKPLTVVRL